MHALRERPPCSPLMRAALTADAYIRTTVAQLNALTAGHNLKGVERPRPACLTHASLFLGRHWCGVPSRLTYKQPPPLVDSVAEEEPDSDQACVLFEFLDSAKPLSA